jgi:hypothetical protein
LPSSPGRVHLVGLFESQPVKRNEGIFLPARGAKLQRLAPRRDPLAWIARCADSRPGCVLTITTGPYTNATLFGCCGSTGANASFIGSSSFTWSPSFQIRCSVRLAGYPLRSPVDGDRCSFTPYRTPKSRFVLYPVFPDFRQSPVLPSFTNATEVRALPSTGITRLPRYL